MVIDTNVLVYAAKADSEFHSACRQFLDDRRTDPSPVYLTWGVCYEFVRVVTHPAVYEFPWTSRNALKFIGNLLATDGFFMLTETDRHLDVWSQTLDEFPETRGSIMHDLHTAVLMREHGISRICTRDSDFYRFPFLTVFDPLRQHSL